MKKLFSTTTVAAFCLCAVTASASAAAEEPTPSRFSVPDAAAFFSQINLDYPGLEAVKKALKEGKESAAISAYVQFVSSRTDRRLPPPSPFDSEDLKVADAITEHSFSFEGIRREFPKEAMNWRYDFSINEWYNILHRMGYLVSLAQAHQETGEAKYIETFCALLGDWIQKNPVINTVSWKGDAMGWRALEVGIRTKYWLSAFQIARKADAFDTSLRFEMLKSLMEHGRYMDDYNRVCRLGNWQVHILSGYLRLALMFPEWKASETRRQQGNQLSEQQLQGSINADGFQLEMTTGYHGGVIRDLTNLHELNTLNGLAGFSEEGVVALRRGKTFIDKIRMPNGVPPMLGDGNYYLETPGRQPDPDTEVFDDSFLLPASGLVLMRERRENGDALYCLFDNAPNGAGGHSHPDWLQLILYAYDRPLLVDPGRGPSYNDPLFRKYYKRARAHNIVVVDEKPIEERRERGQVFNQAWQTNEIFDYARGILKDVHGVDHIREVLFVKKGGFWVVRDTLLGEGTHSMEQLFHFPPGELSIDKPTKMVSTSFSDSANLRIIPVKPGELTLRRSQGYMTRKDKTHVEVPVIGFFKKEIAPLSSTLILFPLKKGDPRQPQVVKALQREDGLHFQVESGPGELFQFHFEDNPEGIRASCGSDGKSFTLRSQNGNGEAR